MSHILHIAAWTTILLYQTSFFHETKRLLQLQNTVLQLSVINESLKYFYQMEI